MASISLAEAISLISQSSKYRHSILVSKIMSSIARHFQIENEEWMLAGLLHDLDYDIIDGDMSKHGLVAASMLHGKVSEDVLHAIMSHDHRTGVEPVNLLDKSLKFADALAVLIEDQSIHDVPENDEYLRLLSSESDRKPWISEIIEAYCAEYDLKPIHLLREVLT